MDKAELSERDLALYGKLHASRDDIGIARACAAFIQRKGWHSFAFMRRGGVFIQQVSFTTTMIVAYARPFSSSRGNINFPERLLKYRSDESAFHKQLIKLRNEEYAHSDVSSYDVTPLKGDFIKSIQSIRDVRFSAKEIALFLSMTEPLIDRIDARMEELRLSGC